MSGYRSIARTQVSNIFQNLDKNERDTLTENAATQRKPKWGHSLWLHSPTQKRIYAPILNSCDFADCENVFPSLNCGCVGGLVGLEEHVYAFIPAVFSKWQVVSAIMVLHHKFSSQIRINDTLDFIHWNKRKIFIVILFNYFF